MWEKYQTKFPDCFDGFKNCTDVSRRIYTSLLLLCRPDHHLLVGLREETINNHGFLVMRRRTAKGREPERENAQGKLENLLSGGQID